MNGYKALSTAVLWQAFEDLRLGVGMIYQDCLRFFESGDFRLYANILDLDQSVVYNAYRAVVENKTDQGFLSFFEEE